MGKTFVLTAVLFAALATATPAWAQEVGVGPPDEVIYSQGKYAVTEDGFLIYDGDVAHPCSEVGIHDASPADQPTGGEIAQAQVQRAREGIQACQAAGFPTAADVSPVGTSASDDASSPSGASNPTSAGPQEASPSVSTAADAGAELPDTGGSTALLALPLLASGTTLVAGGLLALRAKRR